MGVLQAKLAQLIDQGVAVRRMVVEKQQDRRL
jgi:hypothetical protein